jgi:hypothetical protein
MKINQLKLYPGNPRKISKEQLDKLAKSLESFKKMLSIRKIVIDENNVILASILSKPSIKACTKSTDDTRVSHPIIKGS